MVDATVISKYLCGSNTGIYFITYELNSVGTSSSELFSLPLFSKNLSRSYLHPHEVDLSGEAYGVEILQYSVDCNSEDFDLKILNVSDENKEDTVNQVYDSSNINKYEHINDTSILYLNQEDSQTNNLYMLVNNNDGSNETGAISVQLVYRIIKTKSDGTAI